MNTRLPKQADLMKELDRIDRFNFDNQSILPRKRGKWVGFEQVKTVVGQWLADQKPKLDSTRRLVDQWFTELNAHPEIEFDDMDALERLIQAEVERRLKEDGSSTVNKPTWDDIHDTMKDLENRGLRVSDE